jgi:hypothetical protein
VVYWGDIDTHGFAILNRLRHHLPHARSMLHGPSHPAGTPGPLDHRAVPNRLNLDRLDQAESALYADLISDSYAPSVRLEQERISFSSIEKALADR